MQLQVRAIVASLPDKYRIVVYMFYTADMSIKEIAKVLKIPEGTVKSRLFEAKKRIRKQLEDSGYDR